MIDLEEVLLMDTFDVRHQGVLPKTRLQDRVPGTPAEIDVLVAALLSANLIVEPTRTTLEGSIYLITPLAWRKREQCLRDRGLRHDRLVDPTPESLCDLLLALLMAGTIENRRRTGAVLGIAQDLTREEISVYLPEVSYQALELVVARAVDDGLIRHSSKLLRQADSTGYVHGPALTVSARGRDVYRDRVQAEFQLLQDESILDLLASEDLLIFNSWQSEFNPSRSAIDWALSHAVEDLNETGRLRRRLRIVLATQPGDGAARIDISLLERIRKANFFVADLTAVAHHDGRLCPNDNVLVEVGYALASKPPEHIVLLAKNRPDWAAERGRLAFDIAHVRRHIFDSKGEAKGRIRIELEAALLKKKWLGTEH